jgi:bifunctional UDP-N-acetylglucosamine pyrophosphorylase/glucosamine-1-phosphate N-acetyltransferase
MSDIHVVILAAGQGTRMKSALPKVLHRVCGSPMVEYVVRVARTVAPTSITIIIGHQAETVRVALRAMHDVQFVEQQPQLGTAHALMQCAPSLRGKEGTLLLLSGDVPLLRHHTLARLLDVHLKARATVSLLTAIVPHPAGYGRVVRHRGTVARIVEERDTSPAERVITEINAGVYAFDLGPLWDALQGIAPQNAQGEFYLTDLIGIYHRRALTVEAVVVDNPEEIRGINSRIELAGVSKVVRHEKNKALMTAGVTLIDPETTYIDPEVEIGADTVIHPGVVIEGKSQIGTACEIQAYVRMADTILGDRVTVQNFCVLVGVQVAEGARVGPFAHVRQQSRVGPGARVGNFVELKETTLGQGSKAMHLSYLGDATIGSQVNVGAGTITCNYDGERKHPTVIEDGAFIGSDSQLIAPVTIGKGAYVAAGSSVTTDVPPGALGIARGRQANVEGWAEKRKGGQKAQEP